MASWLRFLRKLKSTEVQAKVPMLEEPSAVGKAKKTWAMIAVRDPEIYPLVACVGIGVVMFVAYNIHNFTKNPDLSFSKTRRETPEMDRMDPAEAEEFTKHHAAMAALRPTPVSAKPRANPITAAYDEAEDEASSSSNPGARK